MKTFCIIIVAFLLCFFFPQVTFAVIGACAVIILLAMLDVLDVNVYTNEKDSHFV